LIDRSLSVDEGLAEGMAGLESKGEGRLKVERGRNEENNKGLGKWVRERVERKADIVLLVLETSKR